jgi:small subunit ribosomal protein S6
MFILDPAAKEEAVKEAIERVQTLIKAAGGTVQNVQKLDQRPFARPSSKRSSGFYVNFSFTAPAKAIAELDAKFHLETSLMRWQITRFQEVSLPVRTRRETEDREPIGAGGGGYRSRDRE